VRYAVLVIAACSAGEEQLPLPSTINECIAMDICNARLNSTGLIRARVAALGKPVVMRVLGTTAWFTPAALENMRVIHGRGPMPFNSLLLEGKVGESGMTEAGPLKDASGAFMTEYFFINDALGIPAYALGCGGALYWPVPGDGGEPLVQSGYEGGSVLVSGSTAGKVITDFSFLAQAHFAWGATRCPP